MNKIRIAIPIVQVVLALVFCALLSAWMAVPASAASDGGTITASAETLTAAATTSPATSILAGPITGTPAEPGELLSGGMKVLNDWRTAGWMAAMVALCNLLMMILKRVPFVASLFKRTKPWVQPVIVLAVGAIGGFLSGFMTGGLSGGFVAMVGGFGAGFSAVGADTAINRMTPVGIAEVNAMRAVKEAVAAGDKEIGTKVDALKAALDKMAVIPDRKERLKALASYANGALKPPKPA